MSLEAKTRVNDLTRDLSLALVASVVCVLSQALWVQERLAFFTDESFIVRVEDLTTHADRLEFRSVVALATTTSRESLPEEEHLDFIKDLIGDRSFDVRELSIRVLEALLKLL